MVLKSPAEPLGSSADRPIRGTARLNRHEPRPRDRTLGGRVQPRTRSTFDGANATARPPRAACVRPESQT
jgi:hypothetical protein